MKKQTLICTLILFSLLSCESRESESKETKHLTEKHVELHPNGKVKIKGDIVKDLKQGKWESFYENGIKWSESNYLFGKRNGPYKVFYPNGKLKIHGGYENDKKKGVWFFYNENGQFQKEINFNQPQSHDSN